MVISAWLQTQAIAYGNTVSVAVKEPTGVITTQLLAEDFMRGGDRFYATAQFAALSIRDRVKQNSITPADVALYSILLETARLAANHPATGARLSSLELWLLNMLFMDLADSPIGTLRNAEKDHLLTAVLRHSAHAPEREDMAAALLLSLDAFTQGNKAEQFTILEKILAIAPNHRSARWLMGALLASDAKTREDGLAMQAQAVADGAAHVFPIEMMK